MQTSLAWLAGVIDGEGSITFDKKYGKNGITPRITITNTNDALILHCMSILEMIGVEYAMRRVQGGKLIAGRIVIAKRESVKILLEAVMDHLVAKAPQASVLFEYLNVTVFRVHSPELKEEFRQKMRVLNHPNSGLSVETVHCASHKKSASEEPVRTSGEPEEADGNDLPRIN